MAGGHAPRVAFKHCGGGDAPFRSRTETGRSWSIRRQVGQEHFNINPNRIVIGGFSVGGGTAMGALMHHDIAERTTRKVEGFHSADLGYEIEPASDHFCSGSPIRRSRSV